MLSRPGAPSTKQLPGAPQTPNPRPTPLTEVVSHPSSPPPPPAARCCGPGVGGAGRQSAIFRERAQGRGKESLRDGQAGFPQSLGHWSRNPGLTLDSAVKAPCLGPSPSQLENLRGPRELSLRGCQLARVARRVTPDRMAAKPCAGEPSPLGTQGCHVLWGPCESKPSPSAEHDSVSLTWSSW